jgi:hypothetical protein
MLNSRQPPWGPPVSGAMKLSEIDGRIELRCDLCMWHGRYRADRLLREFGDVTVVEVLLAIARRGGCNRALHPPDPSSVLYNDHVCQVRRHFAKRG